MISKEYNSEREKLIFPEYGRHIQKMARALMAIEDREERTRQAHIVVDVMGNLNNVLRDTDDFKHKLWDHLFILSDFKLDVDFPYETPTHEDLAPKPEKLEYPKHFVGYKQYGNNIRRMIDSLIENEDPEYQEIAAAGIVKFMKFKSYEYNQEYPSNEVVMNDFMRFSRGKIEVSDEILQSAKIITKKKPNNQQKKEVKTHRNNNNNNSNNNNSNNPRNKHKNQPQQQASTKKFFRHKDREEQK